jgi:8-amino-7-oxononanoate synthase
VIDLASSLYLGLAHPSGALRPWRALTLGRPAALATDPIVPRLEPRLAGLLGTETAGVGRSTTHLCIDVSSLLAPGSTMLLDTSSYPSLRWGAERAAGTGRTVRTFARGDLRGLARSLASRPSGGLILTDGLCCGCGTPTPLRDYIAVAERYRANVVMDDTQAVGILGTRAGPVSPWGRGGGGTAAWLGLAGAPRLIIVASLAKALGAPLATIAGCTTAVDRWRRTSETRVHSSPPASAELAALERALTANDQVGDRLRARLLDNITLFCRVLAKAGLRPLGGLFPIQSLAVRTPDVARALHRRLRRAGVLGVLQPASNGARIAFVLTAAHPTEAVHKAAELIAYHAAASDVQRLTRGAQCSRCGGGRAGRRAA